MDAQKPGWIVFTSVTHESRGGGTGSGRWKKKDQERKARLESDLKHLEQGRLPSEVAAAARASADALRNGARQNAQHHAGGDPAPSGRVPGTGSNSRAGGAGERRSAGGGGGGGSTGTGMADVDDDNGEKRPTNSSITVQGERHRGRSVEGRHPRGFQSCSILRPSLRPSSSSRALARPLTRAKDLGLTVTRLPQVLGSP